MRKLQNVQATFWVHTGPPCAQTAKCVGRALSLWATAQLDELSAWNFLKDWFVQSHYQIEGRTMDIENMHPLLGIFYIGVINTNWCHRQLLWMWKNGYAILTECHKSNLIQHSLVQCHSMFIFPHKSAKLGHLHIQWAILWTLIAVFWLKSHELTIGWIQLVMWWLVLHDGCRCYDTIRPSATNVLTCYWQLTHRWPYYATYILHYIHKNKIFQENPKCRETTCVFISGGLIFSNDNAPSG